MQIQQIPIEKLESNPFQYRTLFPEAEMAELTASVMESGVLQPIQVRPVVGKKHAGIEYQIIAGERRYRASKAAYKKTIPAVVREMSDIEALTVAIIENSQREDPDDWATAQGIKRLMEMHAQRGEPLSESATARKLNKSLGYVRNHLALLKLRPSLQEAAQKHNNIKSSLFEIQKINDAETERDLLEQIENGASYSVIRSEVEKYLQDEQWKRESLQPDRFTRDAITAAQRREREAERHVSETLEAVYAKLATLPTWLPECSAGYKKGLPGQWERIEAALERCRERGA